MRESAASVLMGFLNTDVVVLERRGASMPPAVSNLASEHSSAGRAPLSQGSLRARAAHAFRLSHWPASSDSGQPGRWNGESRKTHEIGRCELISPTVRQSMVMRCLRLTGRKFRLEGAQVAVVHANSGRAKVRARSRSARLWISTSTSMLCAMATASMSSATR